MKTSMYEPYQLVRVRHEDFGHVGEVISRETPEGTIMVRMVPNDPTTLRELPLSMIEPISGAGFSILSSI